MSRCGGAARQSLVLSALLVISAAVAVYGCSECLMYHIMEYQYFSIRPTEKLSLWFLAEGPFSFSFHFIREYHTTDTFILPVSDGSFKWRKMIITLDPYQRPTIELEERIILIQVNPVIGLTMFISEGAKVFISQHRSLLERNDFCLSISRRVTGPSVATPYVTESGDTKPDEKKQPSTTSPLEKHLDNRTLFILLVTTVIVAVIAMIYATVFHYKYRKLVLTLKPVVPPMLNFALEYDQTDKKGNNSELRMSHLGQAFYPKEETIEVTYPQQTAPHNTDLRQVPPRVPSERPKSHESMNSIYDPMTPS